MKHIHTSYLGLQLSSPVVVASSPYSADIEGVRSAAEAGAGAVVLKSIFEEQIIGHADHLSEFNTSPFGDTADYLQHYVGEDYRSRFLHLVTEAKAQTSIPIIVSINCIGVGARWVDYAKELASAGADALEINAFTLAADRHIRSEQVEEEYQYVVRRICAAVKIPVSVKLPLRLTAPINLIDRLWGVGARGVVLYNRSFEPDVDIEALHFKPANPFSEVVELRNSLRWIALCTRVVPQVDVAVSTGVHSGAEAIKALLCGARAVQVCTAIHNGGYEAINEINQAINTWGREHGFRTIEEFRGRVAEPPGSDDDLLLRTQYMRYFPKG